MSKEKIMQTTTMAPAAAGPGPAAERARGARGARGALGRAVLTRRGLLATAPVGGAVLAAACGTAAQPGGAPTVKPATIRYLHVVTGQQVWEENWGKIFSTFEAKYPGSKVSIETIDSLQRVP